MILFDLPLEPGEDGRYVLLENHDAVLHFASRHDALAHAMARATARAAQGLPTSISVEGGDGIWRIVQP